MNFFTISFWKNFYSSQAESILVSVWSLAFTLPLALCLSLDQIFTFRPWHYIAYIVTLATGICCKNPLKFTTRQVYFVYFLIGSLICIAPITGYFGLEINGFDFSIYDWMSRPNFFKEIGYEPIHSSNHFGVHATWILFPIYSLRTLWGHPLFLIVLGSAAIWLAVIPLWFYLESRSLDRQFNITLCLAYLSCSFTATLINKGFRIECLYPLAVFSFIWAWENSKTFLWILFLSCFLCIKEDAPLYLLGFASYLIVFKKHERRLGAFLFLSSATLFFLNLNYFQASFVDPQFKKVFMGFWAHYGKDLLSISQNILLSPTIFFSDIIQSGWWKIYLVLGFLPIFSPRFLAFSLPGIILLGTARGSVTMHQYGSYYPMVLVCLALLGVADVYKNIPTRFPGLKTVVLFIVFTFPLFHASSLKFYPHKLDQYHAIQGIAQELEKSKAGKICVQAGLIPYLGYHLPIENLSNACLKEADYALISPELNPYPHSKAYLENLSTSDNFVISTHQNHVISLLRLKTNEKIF